MSNSRSSTSVIGLGIIWLLLAGILLIHQLNQRDITVKWDTQSELNTAGFHLYRSTSPDKDFTLITDEIIPAQGSGVSGSSYSFKDTDVVPGQTYYYLLEEIEYDSTTIQYQDDIFSGQDPLFEWWAILLIALAIIVGIGLIITGLHEGN